MRFTCVIVLLSFFVFNLNAQEIKKKKLVVKYTRSYCGGARPNEEIINALNQPRILANCKIRIEQDGPLKKSWSAKTDANGEVSLKLKKGKYNFYIGKNDKNNAELPFDKNCKKLNKKNLANFEIEEKETLIEIRIPCNPCDPSLKERQ